MNPAAVQPNAAVPNECRVALLTAIAEELRMQLNPTAHGKGGSDFSYATGRIDQAAYLRSLRATRSGNGQSNHVPREPRVCIGCGRRDTRDPSCICFRCRVVRDGGARHEDHREDRTFGAHGRRACPPGPPLTGDDMESDS